MTLPICRVELGALSGQGAQLALLPDWDLPICRVELGALSGQGAQLALLPDWDPQPMSCTSYGATQQPAALPNC